MQAAKKFHNYSTEDFTGFWDKVAYTVKAGETIMLPGFLADHIAKHFVDREMMKENKVVALNSEFSRKPYLDKCFVGESIAVHNELEAEVKALNEVVEKPKNKGGRPKKTEETTEFSEVL